MSSAIVHGGEQPLHSVTGSAPFGTFQTDIPLRLDRLPWSRWHLRMATALGITFLLDGLEGGIGGSLSGALKSATTLHFSDSQVGISSTGYLAGTVLGALVLDRGDSRLTHSGLVSFR